VQREPQLFGLASLAQRSPQRCVPLTQVNVHAPPTQAGTPLAGAVQRTHVGPHSVTLSSGAQVLPQAWKPASHTTPHVPPTHVAEPPGGATHGVHDVPHEAGESSLRHEPPHA
jgi:hypothetical protein